MARPRKYRTAKERAAARRAARRKWMKAHPDQWRAVLARSYMRRKYRATVRRLSQKEVST
jgi:hypothetical protein